MGIGDGIMAGDYWRRPLGAEGRARNQAIGRLRAPVERNFAILKRWYGYRCARYRGLVRNAARRSWSPKGRPHPSAPPFRLPSARS